jgi:hypothetical protein
VWLEHAIVVTLCSYFLNVVISVDSFFQKFVFFFFSVFRFQKISCLTIEVSLVQT